MRSILAALVVTSLAPATALATPLPPQPDAGVRCDRDSGCPDNYEQTWPYLERFCAGRITDTDLADIDALAARGALTKSGVEAIFNVFGAAYGYEFKMLKALNTFYYAPSAAQWLPQSCVALVRSKTSAKDMPFALTKTRDAIRRIYDARFPKGSR